MDRKRNETRKRRKDIRRKSDDPDLGKTREQGMTKVADLKKNIKNVWMKSMEAIGNTASSIASNTRFKVDEMNLQNRRREILNDFGAKAYALWLKGETFPETLSKQLEELQQLDNQLNDLRAERIASNLAKQSEDFPKTQEETAEDALKPAEGAEEKEGMDPAAPITGQEDEKTDHPADVPVIPELEKKDDVPVVQVAPPSFKEKKPTVHEAINDLFDQATPSVDEMAEKVNQSLNSLQRFSAGTDQKPEEQNEENHQG